MGGVGDTTAEVKVCLDRLEQEPVGGSGTGEAHGVHKSRRGTHLPLAALSTTVRQATLPSHFGKAAKWYTPKRSEALHTVARWPETKW